MIMTNPSSGGNVYTIPVPGLKNESPRLVLGTFCLYSIIPDWLIYFSELRHKEKTRNKGDRIILEPSGERGKNSLEEYHAFVHSIRKVHSHDLLITIRSYRSTIVKRKS